MAKLDRRHESRIANLGRANEVRQQRASLRLLVKRDQIDPVQLIRKQHGKWEKVIERWRLSMVLALIKGIGPVTEAEIYAAGSFSPSQPLSSLSLPRRAQLAKLCEEGRRLSGHGQ